MLYLSKWSIGLVAVISAVGVLFSAPNFLGPALRARLPIWLQPISLGLDLQGGSHLLIEVDVHGVVREQLIGLAENVRASLRRARIRQQNVTVLANGVTIFIPDSKQHEEVLHLLEKIDSHTQVEQTGGNAFLLAYTEQWLYELENTTVLRSIEVIRRRVDESGTRDVSVFRQGRDRIIVELPGINDPDRIKSLIGRTAKLAFRLVEITNQYSEDRSDTQTSSALNSDDTLTRLPIATKVEISGDDLVDAQPSLQNGQMVVHFRFNSLGGEKFGRVTQENIGKQLAIILDGKVISAPVIREPILGGSGTISGSFTTQEAQDLALLLRAGALPASLNYLEERTVGPGLGTDSIRAGTVACVVGLGLVVTFMIIAYGLFGFFADIALLVNLILLVGLLSAINATLTLPGIAGIVLTLGMAVDANVLIYERMREEKRNGRSILNALNAGFQRALTTILDSNLTTLIAAVLLFQFGSGPVRGFAVTLGFGLLTSVFTATMVTRLLVFLWLKRQKQIFPL